MLNKRENKKQEAYTPLEEKIILFLHKNLPRPRFLHSLGVMKTAEAIAARYHVDRQAARLAGLLHDCSRGYSVRTMARLACSYDRRIAQDKILMKNPTILHGFASAAIARRYFSITDKRVLQAMALHTLAGPRMSLLDWVVYLADITAPDRRFKELPRLRRMVVRNIHAALREALRIKIIHVLRKKQMLHGNAVKAWNEIINHEKQKEK